MIIALGGNKSSSGKTTVGLNLAAALIEQGHTVRLWDLDGQHDLSTVGLAAGLEVARPKAIALRASIAAAPADYHIIECTPRKEFESETVTVLTLADRLIVPVQCEYMMLRGLANFTSTIDKALPKNPGLQWKALVEKLLPRQKKHLAGFLASDKPRFETIIRDSAWIADSVIYEKTVLDYAPRSASARAFRALAKEVIEWR